MSSRSKRTSTAQQAKQDTPSRPSTSSASPAQSPGRQRPPSPTVFARLEEKRELASLNDRLAAYIDRVRQLETENRHLTTQIKSQEDTVSREITNIKSLYETELADARKLLDEVAKEKAKLQIDCGKLKTEADEWKDKYLRADRDLKSTEKKLLSAEAQVNDLQARLNDAVSQRKHWENEYNRLKAEMDTLQKQLATAKKQLEDETVARVDLENRIQSLKEELAFKTQLHESELNETRTRTEIQLDEVDGRLQAEYESRLQDELRLMREDNDNNIRITREEMERNFSKKLDSLKSVLSTRDGEGTRAIEELKISRKRVDELQSEVARLSAQNLAYEKRIRELEAQLQREQDDHKATIAARDAEIRRLREALEEQVQEYRDLLDVKIALDVEIAAYRKLLEGEETRLNLSLSTSSSGTPRRGTPSRKRKRTGAEAHLVQSSSADYEASATATGEVEIIETDPEGKFIKLNNRSDKDISIGGWQLKHTVGEDETVYKFHRSSQVKAGAAVTVWSSDAGQTHTPPTDLVMKNQTWVTGEDMKTSLLNAKGDEMATLEMAKSMTRTTTYGSDVDSAYEGDDRGDQEKCSIM